MRPIQISILACAMAVGACVDAADEDEAASEATSDEVAEENAQPGTVVTVEGIRTDNDDLNPADAVAFGNTSEDAVVFVTTLRGEETEEQSSDLCPAGPMEFAKFGNLTLSFQDDTLVGWALADGPGEPPVTTPNGLTIGSSRAAVEAAPQVIFEQTSLGTEFTADGVDGLMSEDGPNGVVTNLWAGTVCIFR